MRWSVLVALATTLGCTAEPPRECAAPVTGTSPFSTRLNGTFTTEVGTTSVSLMAYFPAGRVPGAPFAIAMEIASETHVAEGVLRDDGGSAELRLSDSCGEGIRVHWAGPADGLLGVGTMLVGTPTDAPIDAEGPLALCPSGGAGPTPAFFARGMLPTAELGVAGNVPIDRQSLASIRGPVEFATSTQGAGFVVRPTRPLSPWTPTVFDTSGVRDIMGRPIGVASLETQVLSATVVDRTFATPPPSGAWLGLEPTVDTGVLRVGSSSGYQFVLGLGAPGAARKLRIRHRFDCVDWTSASVELWSDSGRVVVLATRCSAVSVVETVSLPSDERWALVVRGADASAIPCTFPGRLPAPKYELDEFAFE